MSWLLHFTPMSFTSPPPPPPSVENSYLLLVWQYCDNSLEDINQPLWVQDHHVLQEAICAVLSSKVDNDTKVMVEVKHCEQFSIRLDAKFPSHIFDLGAKWSHKLKSI